MVPVAEDSPRLAGTPLSAGGWISWIVIIVFTAFLLGNTIMVQFGEPVVATEASISDLMQVNLQAKMVVGQNQLQEFLETVNEPNKADDAADSGEENEAEVAPDGKDAGNAQAQAEPLAPLGEIDLSALNTGSYEQRLCNVGILNELKGPDAALDYLDELQQKVVDNDFERSDAQQEMESSARQLIENYRDGNLSPDIIAEAKQQQLKDKLGFSGELLLSPPNARTAARAKLETLSKNAAVAAVSGLIMAVLFFLGGIVALLFILTYVMTGSSPGQFVPAHKSHNIYVETFALWLIAFFGVQLLVQASGLLASERAGLIATPIFFFGSLCVLLWPVLRGVPTSQMFADIGWTRKGILRNTFLAVPAYAAWLPAVLVGFFIFFILMSIAPLPTVTGEFAVPSMPGHPIQHILSGGNRLAWVTVVIAACIAAPVVEETMFRGVLYQHLRGWTGRNSKALSIVIAATVNAFIFASLHPQGILAVPLLMSLAIGFSLVREWRGSLWTSILMHGFNNSMVTLTMYFLL